MSVHKVEGRSLRGLKMIDPETGHYYTPCSIKAVATRDSRILMCLINRGEWELPGGWPSQKDASLEDALRREVREESGLEVVIGALLSAELLRTPNDGAVALVIFRAAVTSDADPSSSSEHIEVRYFAADELPQSVPSPYLRAIDLARHELNPSGE
jgi:8-oxo-dGTP pyrophosphatase MutT (NUDIX family)